ncbi:MAG: hypothetical protein NXI23_25390 [Bacteroidetes bacterium]|jgi:hypothetical protein|nr:hypothetical protein [Bacteroidota bacterium]MDF1863445.1 hypothetical protein [Saprospiraceae bacterium]
MKQYFHLLSSLFLGLIFFSSTANAQFVNFEETWQEFLTNNKISNTSELTKPNEGDKIDYSKYCLMYANSNFCQSRLGDSESLMKEIRGIGEEVYKTIPGYKEKFEDLEIKLKAYHKVEHMWKRFMRTKNISLEELEAVSEAETVCEKGTLAKFSYMMAHQYYCKADIKNAKDKFENRVLKLVEKTSLDASSIEGLPEETAKMKLIFQELPKLGRAWKKFLETGESDGYDTQIPLIECYSIPNMKEYLLRGAADICGKGAIMLKKVKNLQVSNSHDLDANLVAKIEWLEGEVAKNEGNLTALNKAWKEFLPTEKLVGEKKYGYQYCNQEALVRAYVIDGMTNSCEIGEEMLGKIAEVREKHNPELDATTIAKVNKLAARMNQYKMEAATLETLWSEFITNEDTLLKPFQLSEFYCDDIHTIKSWTIRGWFNTCEEGQAYLDKIDDLVRQKNLELDEELACRVLRLRIKIWDCRWWELVVQARAETHAERERFGPEAAKIMYGDLNSEELPCETTVEYMPLDYIGVQYIITAYLCQDIDLAKMGDPEYYKKIATWVDTEVLQKYCEEGLRCKEEFFIYLEGHTDGNVFRGARYKNSLDIPEGTEFTHFVDGDTLSSLTEREITNSLKSNMELGIARAWTVKNQLEFMEVPIKIGAYEHPKEEKGGEYRSIQIELNITKLLLDFYEKRLDELWKASGIGERPEVC